MEMKYTNAEALWGISEMVSHFTKLPFRIDFDDVVVEIQRSPYNSDELQAVVADDTVVICYLGMDGLVVAADDDYVDWLNDEFKYPHWFTRW